MAGDAVVIPETVDVLAVSRVRIALGLDNPRGMLVTGTVAIDGFIEVVELPD